MEPTGTEQPLQAIPARPPRRRRALAAALAVAAAVAAVLVLVLSRAEGDSDAAASKASASAQTSMAMRLDRMLRQFARAHPAFPGVALAVTTPRLTWTGAAGVADRASHKPLAPTATFRIASLTKTFTAAAILRLVEDGKLALGDPIARHLSEASVGLLRSGEYDADEIRVRHLLQHTSGLYDYGEDQAFQAFVVSHPRHRWSRVEQVRFAMTHGRPLSRPGALYHYSDTGYVLLGEMLERVTGTRLADAYRTLLRFDRLRLDETYLETLEPKPKRARPRAHQYLGTLDTTGFDPSFDLYGGGGLVSTVDDLARFYRALLGGRVFEKAATLRTMLGKPGGVRPSELGMGIVGIPMANGGTCWGHGGFWGVVAGHCPRSGVTIASTVNQRIGFEAASSQLHAAVHRLVSSGG
jgi:D-alanyl-D-alanine carboxypeptidase